MKADDFHRFSLTDVDAPTRGADAGILDQGNDLRCHGRDLFQRSLVDLALTVQRRESAIPVVGAGLVLLTALGHAASLSYSD